MTRIPWISAAARWLSSANGIADRRPTLLTRVVTIQPGFVSAATWRPQRRNDEMATAAMRSPAATMQSPAGPHRATSVTSPGCTCFTGAVPLRWRL